MLGAQLAIQRGGECFAQHLEPSGMEQSLLRGAAVEQTIDHRACRDPVGIGDLRRETDVGVPEHAHQRCAFSAPSVAVRG